MHNSFINVEEEIIKLQDIPTLARILERGISETPNTYVAGQKVLNKFFSEHKSPIDIAILLNSGLKDAHILANHLEGNNLIFYRPSAEHRRERFKAFLRGEIHPERKLLLFDDDMLTGATLSEASAVFSRFYGYDPQRIFAYLNYGIAGHGFEPRLAQVDDLIGMATVFGRNLG